MVLVSDMLDNLVELAPLNLAYDWDNCGLLVGDPSSVVEKVLVCLDVTDSIVDEAIANNVTLIVSHHPVIFTPLKNLTAKSLVYKLIQANISVISMHTNLDIACGGVNDVLANTLNLQDISHFDTISEHHSLGRVGALPERLTTQDFASLVKSKLNLDSIKFNDIPKQISKVAVCGGAGSSLIERAVNLECDCLVSSEFKHNHYIEASAQGLVIIDAQHHHTENIIVDSLLNRLKGAFASVDIKEACSNTPPYSFL